MIDILIVENQSNPLLVKKAPEAIERLVPSKDSEDLPLLSALTPSTASTSLTTTALGVSAASPSAASAAAAAAAVVARDKTRRDKQHLQF